MPTVAQMTFEQRLGAVFERTAGKVGPEIGRQLLALIEPKSLAVIVGVLTLWVLSHGVAIGEIIDGIVTIIGVLSIGTAIFNGIDELFEFARGTYQARSDGDLDKAADHLAKAIAIIGIQAVLAVLFRGRPSAGRGEPGPPPPRTPGIRYRPTTVGVAGAPGDGVTSWWGDIEISTAGSDTDRALALYHEQVHQFLTPKLYFLQNFRVEMRVGSYTNSSLWRYIEEVLAETRAQVKVNGKLELFSSFRFPVRNGYVYWRRAGSDPRVADWGGKGVLPEGAGLIASGTMFGSAVQLWFKAGAPPPQPSLGKSLPLPVQPLAGAGARP